VVIQPEIDGIETSIRPVSALNQTLNATADETEVVSPHAALDQHKEYQCRERYPFSCMHARTSESLQSIDLRLLRAWRHDVEIVRSSPYAVL
jgi:hypothetical protein